ncbi:MAG: HAAS signaling domain-containing protein [Candidatus Polarisedimenticolia bacterium]
MPDGVERLNRYLSDLRARLRRLPDAEASEIVEELRSHVLDSVTGRPMGDGEVAAVLQRLGDPGELAELYLTDRLLVRAAASWSPWLLLAALMRAATVSAAAFFALMGLTAAYVAAASFFLAALLKPFTPGRVGLWRLDRGEYSLRLGFGSVTGGEELLGWWIVPIGLAAGAAGIWLAMRIGRWGIERFRRRLPLARSRSTR